MPKLTIRAIEAALRNAPAEGESYLFDSEAPGLGLRIRGGASLDGREARASWVFQWRARGRSRRIKIDAYRGASLEEARDSARAHRATVRAGGDPVEEKREAARKGTTLADAAASYLDDLEARATLLDDEGRALSKRGRPSTAAQFRWLYGRTIARQLGRVEIARLDEARVVAWHRALRKTPAQGNRALTLLSAICGYAERQGLIPRGSNPCRGVERHTERPKRARYSDKELARLGEAMRKGEAEGAPWFSGAAALGIRLMLYCGLRRSEIIGHVHAPRRSEGGGLRWKDVDFEAGTLHLRTAKSGERVVAGGAPAMAALHRARPKDAAPDAPVLPGERQGAPFVGFEKAARRTFSEAGVTWKGSHALRRTFASIGEERLKLGKMLVGALLGHSARGVTEGYVLISGDVLRSAADSVAREIERLLDPQPPAKVVRFRKAR